MYLNYFKIRTFYLKKCKKHDKKGTFITKDAKTHTNGSHLASNKVISKMSVEKGLMTPAAREP